MLALSGIVVGCATVVALINIGHNLQLEALDVFKGLGSDLLVANIQAPLEDRAGTAQNPVSLDAGKLRKSVPEILAAAPLIPSSSDARLNGRSIALTLLGTNAELVDVLDLQLEQGRFFSVIDAGSTHVVLGSNVPELWKQSGVSVGVGDKIALGGYIFQVIGILRRNGENPLIPLIVDDAILLHMDGIRRVVVEPRIRSVLVRGVGGDKSSHIGTRLQRWLERQMPHHTIVVQIPQQLIEGFSRQSRLFSWLLAGVGGIALLIGGIGVMNVMVMSVTERRREIGVRMALGARPMDIMRLFLIESLFLGVTGAATGAVLGGTAAWAFVHFSRWASFSLSWPAVLLGMGSALLTGLLFGLSPAMAAARLTPTHALRDE